MIYLDSASTTSILPEVFEAMKPYLTDDYGNPGSIHTVGRIAAQAVDKAREQVADFLHTTPEHIVFTSSGTEANNLAILGSVPYLMYANITYPKRRHFMSSRIEHESVLRAMNSLMFQRGFLYHLIPVTPQGYVDPSELEQYKPGLLDTTGFLSVMYYNNEIGTQNHIARIGEICRKNHILFHTDCVQAAGQVPIDPDKIGCDFLSISSHKIHGPKGAGALYVRDRSRLYPLIYGGHDQELGLRGGTQNVAAIVGFGKACEIASRDMAETSQITYLYKHEFYETLSEKLSRIDGFDMENDWFFNGCPPRSSGKILSLTFRGVDAESLVLLLDARGICVSAGSACTSHSSKPSHVLTAIGLSDEEARQTVRISFDPYDTKLMLSGRHTLSHAACVFADCIAALRNLTR